ncbi:MAG: PepSY-associated TM helix domain-containing protein [Pseudomonadota bacterium]
MDRARHHRNYDLHSWTGVTLGLFIFIVCFSGCIALFYHELLAWEDPAKRIELDREPAPFNETMTAWVNETEKTGEIEFLNITYPSIIEPYYLVYAHVHNENGEDANHFVRWHPYTLEMLPTRKDGMARWLYDFHRDLMWPAELGGTTIGRALVGAAGVILMLAIITGVVAHTKIFEEMFSLRYLRSVRLKWQDTHKVLGLWGLPFYAMIAFTGAFLGIVAILAPIVAVLAFKGDQETLQKAVLGAPPEPAGIEAPMLSVDDVRARAHHESGEKPVLVVTNNWGDETAIFDVFYTEDKKLKIFETVSISGVTGEVVDNPAQVADSPSYRVVVALAPLHYGTYGGIALKVLYFFLGLALTVITAFGTMMWLERRIHGSEGNRSLAFYRGLSRLHTGVAMGLVVASASLFVHNTIYFGTETARLASTGWTFFGVWFAALGYAFWRKDEYRATAEIMAASGFLLVAAALLNGAITGHFPWSSLGEHGHSPTAWVDLTLISLGASGIALAAALPKKRPEKKRRRKATANAAAPSAAPAE